ncbi:enoyl-CoA hydratase/isomerase family protein [Shewanella gelidii]|uniref:3-hydroxyisobutyryl-CoA hydrolase n=1 Tax=Shewanella gelidii TaxID=1642821 RepID=A0A917JKL7_9GAMM|nr:enoyl-CoA hydratase/isomerase family protein [Shewanella gelidii]MCL1097374.1 enoyl-CoA hydratase/isomerase family protein [Shewanella gelidii]GGI74698.1 enoyl-CoA hydratase [Shewanella gelidii]
MSEQSLTQNVLFEKVATQGGQFVGRVTLNMEKALNALNLDMVQQITKQLLVWQADEDLVCILLDGAGDKAFCAGGDVREIHAAASLHPGEIPAPAVEFFTQEYQLDYLLHTFGKPVVVWGDGIVMGGGLGLMAGASHRIVTDRSRVAMPEVTIGLYPDVSGSYFLNRMPGKSGIFLGMTAYNLNAADAKYVDIGNHYMHHQDKGKLITALTDMTWQRDEASNHQALHRLLNEFEAASDIALGASLLQQHQAQIDELMSGSATDIVNRMQALETEEKWLQRAQKTLLAGSPISWHLIIAQAQLGTELSLAQVFQLELGMSVNCCAVADFCEGVRALLIDKDRNPQWKYSSAKEVPESLVARIMASPWTPTAHPLSQLAG